MLQDDILMIAVTKMKMIVKPRVQLRRGFNGQPKLFGSKLARLLLIGHESDAPNFISSGNTRHLATTKPSWGLSYEGRKIVEIALLNWEATVLTRLF
jgi:hypothetical protein